MQTTTLTFESRLAANPQQVWEWICSIEGISREMSPILQMSSPRELQSITAIPFRAGVPMFRSWIRLGGIIPIDYSDLTLVSLTPGVGFVEESPMGSMRLWRHARQLSTLDDGGCLITDTLTFTPRVGGRLAVACVKYFFTHRHKRLRAFLGEAPNR